MAPLTRLYGPASGPLGFPMLDKQAFALESLLKALPKDSAFAYRKSVLAQKPAEVLPGERSDVSWISTEDPDRANEVVIARGLNDGQYQLNPIVTLQHQYHLPPVARSLWRKVVKDGDRRGVKAKSQYPTRPDGWEGTWPADVAFALVQADLLRGKSIGFLPVKVHTPSAEERREKGWDNVGLVIDEWVLLEYACTFLPAQGHAIVEAVSKSQVQVPEEMLRAMGLDLTLFRPPTVGFTPLVEIERAVMRTIDSWDVEAVVRKCIAERIERARGRV